MIRLAFSLGLMLAPSAWAGEWLWQHPVPQGNTLRAAAVGENLLIAAGDYGTIVRLDRKAREWQHVPSGTQEHLRAIAHAGASTWVAAGVHGATLRSTDAGLRWTPQPSGAKEDLHGLAFAAGLGVAVGSSGTVLVTQDGGDRKSVV